MGLTARVMAATGRADTPARAAKMAARAAARLT